jgi:hypothetical protein
MESDRNLSAPDLAGTQAAAFATAAMNQPARGRPKWLRRLILAFTVVIAAVSLLGLVDKLSGFGKLPRCDAQRTKNTLSDLNKQNKVNASHYNSLKTVTAGDDEVTCTASLALRDGGTLEYDYRIYKDGSGVKVQITSSRRL